MKIIMFYHSLYSDWNHGNAHFLRGVVKALKKRGHGVEVYEPEDGWSLQNLLKDKGAEAIDAYRKYYPEMVSNLYNPKKPLNHEVIFKDADVVLVHEWNSPELIETIGNLRDKYGFKLLFHDTHHRAISLPQDMAQFNLEKYDGALVFGEVLRKIFKENKWVKEAWTWHEAADTDLFKPDRNQEKLGDLVWIGNWGDDEREEELRTFLLNPIKELGLKAKFYGVRYPEHVLKELEEIGIEYGGYLPNFKAPEVFSQYHFTVHVPRRYYVETLPGIPTIRPFEAMACGIPLICSPWEDAENLFTPGEDYLVASSEESMKNWITQLLKSNQLAKSLSENGRKTIETAHSCEHRAQELEKILQSLEEKPTKTISYGKS